MDRWIGSLHQLDQAVQPLAPDRRHQAKLRHVPADGVDSWIRWRISIMRTRCSTITLCCSGLFTSTKRIVGRVTASQIA